MTRTNHHFGVEAAAWYWAVADVLCHFLVVSCEVNSDFADSWVFPVGTCDADVHNLSTFAHSPEGWEFHVQKLYIPLSLTISNTKSKHKGFEVEVDLPFRT